MMWLIGELSFLDEQLGFSLLADALADIFGGGGVIKIIRDISIEDTSGQLTSLSRDYHEAQWYHHHLKTNVDKKLFLNSEDLERSGEFLWNELKDIRAKTKGFHERVGLSASLERAPFVSKWQTTPSSSSLLHLSLLLFQLFHLLHHHLRPQRTSGNQESMQDATVFDKYEPKALWAQHDKRLSEG